MDKILDHIGTVHRQCWVMRERMGVFIWLEPVKPWYSTYFIDSKARTHEQNMFCDFNWNKMKNNEYHIVGTIPKSKIKIVGRGKIDTPKIQIHDRSHSWVGTCISIKSPGNALVLWAQIFTLSEMMRSCKYFPHVRKMPIFIHNRENGVIIKNAVDLNSIHNIHNIRDTTVVIRITLVLYNRA